MKDVKGVSLFSQSEDGSDLSRSSWSGEYLGGQQVPEVCLVQDIHGDICCQILIDNIQEFRSISLVSILNL